MAYENNNENKTPVTGVLGTTFGATALASVMGLLGGNGTGGLFGNGNPAASPIYQLAQKDAEIVRLQAEKYADQQVKELTADVSNLKQRVAAIEVAEPLREQILQERINSVSATVARLVQPMIPNANIAPGWGPAFVSPFPPVVPTVNVQGGASTPATTSSSSASQAA